MLDRASPCSRRRPSSIRWFIYRMHRAIDRGVEAVAASADVSDAAIDSDELRRFRVRCLRAEQRAIADYLDTETARIDALIAKKQRLSSTVRRSRDGDALHRVDRRGRSARAS